MTTIFTTQHNPTRVLARAMLALLAASAFTFASHAQAAGAQTSGQAKQGSDRAIILQNHARANAQSSGKAMQGSDRAIILQNRAGTNAQPSGKAMRGSDRAIILQNHQRANLPARKSASASH